VDKFIFKEIPEEIFPKWLFITEQYKKAIMEVLKCGLLSHDTSPALK
jgi:hypothetical protein